MKLKATQQVKCINLDFQSKYKSKLKTNQTFIFQKNKLETTNIDLHPFTTTKAKLNKVRNRRKEVV